MSGDLIDPPSEGNPQLETHELRFVVLAQDLPRQGLSGMSKAAVPWMFIGRSLAEKMRVESALGRERWVSAAEKIQESASALRAPFIEEIGRLGTCQTDPVNWLASKFSSKSIWQSKFFERTVMTRTAPADSATTG